MRANLRQIAQKPAHGLRVLSYNVLAQSLIRRDVYTTNGNAIKWAQRFPAMSEELVAYDPDILLLQEVDEAKLKNWAPLLESEPLNMELRFFCAENKNHGIIIAFKRSKMRHIAHKNPHYDAVEGPPQQVGTRGTGAAMVVEIVDTRARLVIGTTHLYWHPGADYERLRQLLIFLDAAASLKQEYDARGLVLGGDFNSTPDSPAYEFLTTGELSAAAVQALELSAQTALFGPFNAKPGEGHPTLLSDAPAAVAQLQQFLSDHKPPRLTSCYAALGGEPAFTNWTETFRETIDYILVSPEVTPRYVLPLPQAAELGPEPSSLPRSRGELGYPSDHFVIAADIELSSPASP